MIDKHSTSELLMTGDHSSLRDELERRLLAADAKLPASSLERLGRTAIAGMAPI